MTNNLDELNKNENWDQLQADHKIKENRFKTGEQLCYYCQMKQYHGVKSSKTGKYICSWCTGWL